MKIPRPPESLVTRFDALLATTPGERRLMFGCACGFLDGNMFTGLYGDRMFVRLAEEDRRLLLDCAGAAVFEPMKGRPMREYVVLPPELVDDNRAVKDWLARSMRYARTLPAKGKTKPRAKPKASAKPVKAAKTANRG